MVRVIVALLTGYLTSTGFSSMVALVGRGLNAAAGRALEGRYGEAAVQAAASLAAPAVAAYRGTAALVGDVVRTATDLAFPLLTPADDLPGDWVE